ncbi:CIA30 family protein [Shewanella aegiceratis]|uniref:CIA30 family protein n=1 Tax=Shewanella aegiceratis TaxID=2864203 RepID=UPI001C658A93|nr:CIA30 family protein [Shewanella aegiceratis]QYJ80962.1 CIA30 family protein [Shewanella aegiceratis]
METLALLTHPGHWQIVNDGVMGGRSQSELSEFLNANQQYRLRFSGNVSLENNGGFASVSRTLSQEEQQILQQARPGGIRLTTLGDGKHYQLRLKVLKQGELVSYKANFDTQAGRLEQWTFTPGEFIETFRGADYPTRPYPDLTQLVAVGLLIGNGQAGDFELQLAELAIQYTPASQ